MTHNQHFDLYIASCRDDGGIYRYKLNEKGETEFCGKTDCPEPMYMIRQKDKMYVLLRAPFENSKESGLLVYHIAENGDLINPSETIPTKGEIACHLTLWDDNIYAANYISGSVIKIPDKVVIHNGYGVNKERQEGPHTHYVGVTPDNKYLCVTDLGLDSIFLYDKNLNCVSVSKVSEGHGARHIVFSEDSGHMFVANELMSTLSVFSYEDGKLTLKDTKSCLPDNFNGESTASAIRLHNGDIFVSNRGHESIAQMGFDGKALSLKGFIPCGGKTPRDFDFAKDIIISCNQDSDNVVLINKDKQREIQIPAPVCVCIK